MDEQTYRLLEQLATQFNVTVEYLWGVLVRQAFINSLNNVLVFLLIIAAFFLLTKWTIRAKDEIEEIWPGAPILIFWGLLVIFSLIFSITSFQDTLTGFLNPEYFALQQILGLVK